MICRVCCKATALFARKFDFNGDVSVVDQLDTAHQDKSTMA
jgi:hypothetical protein